VDIGAARGTAPLIVQLAGEVRARARIRGDGVRAPDEATEASAPGCIACSCVGGVR
jgi:hypothetical protein